MNILNFPWKELGRDGSALFIYDLDRLRLLAAEMKTAMKTFAVDTKLVFSLKSNPHPRVIAALHETLDGFDVSSELELQLCQELGISGDKISVSGPGKTDSCLALAQKLNVSVVQIDSLSELASAQKLGLKNLSFRIHTPDIFSLKLGLSEEELMKAFSQLQQKALGLHLYLGRESFSWEKLAQAAQLMGAWFKKYPQAFVDAPVLFLGPGVPGGLVPDSYSETPFSESVTFELGRGVVADCGVYAAPVLARKSLDRGGESLILHGGLQHLGSPFVTFAQKLSALQPLVIRDGEVLQAEAQEFLVAGSLCLGHDILHPRMRLPENIRRGDWVVFPRAGAYGLTAGVPFFIGQDLPKEVVFEHGRFEDQTLKKFKLYHESFGI